MGQVIPLARPSEEVIDELRKLIRMAEIGVVTGFAYVALKQTTVAYGVVNIEDGIAAIDAAETLIDAISSIVNS